jgi:fucose 4-O-acetylase-like acetyltransferase
MALLETRTEPAVGRQGRLAYADNLKVLLVAGVVVGHATMVWADLDTWVFEEPPVREPLLTLLDLVALVGALFAMATFFYVAGTFTPDSLERKGARRFVTDRLLRLGVPLAAYVVLLAPVVEFADEQDNAAWDRGFLAFVPAAWRHPAPGPLWFLWVLLVFSFAYVAVRALVPRRRPRGPLRARQLVVAGALVAVASYAIRLLSPLGEETIEDLYAAQAPAWVAGFALGVLGAGPLSERMRRGVFRVTWSAMAGVLVLAGVTVGLGSDVEVLLGEGTGASLALAVLEGAVVVTMPVWLLDVFRRRADRGGRLVRELGRAAFGAYVVHQVVLIGAVVSTRWVPFAPEVEWVMASVLGVAGSFAVGALLVRVPGVRRVV